MPPIVLLTNSARDVRSNLHIPGGPAGESEAGGERGQPSRVVDDVDPCAVRQARTCGSMHPNIVVEAVLQRAERIVLALRVAQVQRGVRASVGVERES